ncbi:MAG: c-type cytochrome, partial [Saprospiraceae bacterium]|nr:c-type cytochrome [Saprospiraceae bacterium]
VLLMALSDPLKTDAQEGEWQAPAWADDLANPYANDESTLKNGGEQFEIYCSPCHGHEGKGDGAAGVGLPVKPKDFSSPDVMQQSDGALFWKLNTGRGNMVPYELLLPENVRWQLITYVRFLGEKHSDD